MHNSRIYVALSAIFSMGLIGCGAPEAPKSSPITAEKISLEEAGGFECDAQSSQSFIGQKATANIGQKIVNLSGAQSLRWIPPRTPVTRDYRTDRVNIHYNDDSIVQIINCG